MAESAYRLRGKRVFVAGHRGMVGSAIVRRLAREDCVVLTAGRADADLTRQAEVEAWFEVNRPDAVFVAAAKVGGILANDSYPADFLLDNLKIETHVIENAWRHGARRLLFLSPCEAPAPRRTSHLPAGRSRCRPRRWRRAHLPSPGRPR